MSFTKLQKLVVNKFRGLQGVEIEFGDHLTVICGKNGTSKSSILGIAAQIFSFEKDWVGDVDLAFQPISGGTFKSQFSEHFRLSNRYDAPKSMSVSIELYDGYTQKAATAELGLTSRLGVAVRAVVRKNSTATGNASRNFTHPVIYLSLKRLFPITARDYYVKDFDYLEKNKKLFIQLTNELLNRNSSFATGTAGTINSAVSHGNDYDQDSVSAGEDNAGQIVMALMSFKKLKDEYPNYKGGLLLIDEADAGLFPTAQINLLRMLDRLCNELKIQVVMTSHSPVIIEYAFEQSKLFRRRYKTVYLSNTYGGVQVAHDWSWAKISADINTETIEATAGTSLPRVNVYFEDSEAQDFFSALMVRQPIKKFAKMMTEVTLGCSNYLQLIKCKIPEFATSSIVCLDADQQSQLAGKKYNSVVLLPGQLPPDQLLFEHLFNLPPDDEFWDNELHFTRDVFTNEAREVIGEFEFYRYPASVAENLAAYGDDKKPREVFKRFYKKEKIQKIVKSGTKPYNPWRHWVKNNPDEVNSFLERLKVAMHNAMREGFSVDPAKLEILEVKLERV